MVGQSTVNVKLAANEHVGRLRGGFAAKEAEPREDALRLACDCFGRIDHLGASGADLFDYRLQVREMGTAEDYPVAARVQERLYL
jgi:hypothetical protein